MVGSYNSEVANVVPTKYPPATNTLPLANKIAVWVCRGIVIDPVTVHVPVAGLYTSALEIALGKAPPATKTLPLLSSVLVW